MANFQISFDLLVLTALIHFSGGVENPFIFYFIFHMIIASILLSRLASFFQATFAVLLFIFIVVFEYLGRLPHYTLQGFIPFPLYNNLLYVIGASFAFISTLYIAVYMATSISSKLKEREQSLKEANALLNEKDRIKSEYVLRVSHDIKEHLAAIQSCIEPVAEGRIGSLEEEQRNLLERAEERTKKLLFFVKSLLEITRLKLSKGLKMKEFYFNEILESITRDIGTRAKNKNLIFNIDIAPSINKIKGVRLYLEEALFNILMNSIKYTPSGGEVKLKAVDKRRSILFKIEDSGIGIPSEDLSSIFSEFFRAKNAREIEKTGTGLGLSIAKKIVEMHKGKIWLASEIGKGTRIFIELPK